MRTFNCIGGIILLNGKSNSSFEVIQNCISHSKLYFNILIPHYATPFAAIMGYNSYLLPIPFQDLAFEIQRTLFRGFDRMELSAFC